MYKTILILILVIQIHFLDAQTNLDSRWNIWLNEKLPDTTRLYAINGLIWKAYLFSQPDSAFVLAQIMHDFALESNQLYYRSKALNNMGISHWIRDNYDEALEYMEQGLILSQEINDLEGQANLIGNIGSIYRDKGDLPNALEYHNRSLDLEEARKNRKGMAQSLNNIGLVYGALGEYSKSLDYHLASLKIKEELGDKRALANSYSNIGSIYKDLGDFETALSYFNRSLRIREENNNSFGKASALNNLGLLYYSMKEYSTALDFHLTALALREEIGDQGGIALSYHNIGKVYADQGAIEKALEYLDKAISIFLKLGEKRRLTGTYYVKGNSLLANDKPASAQIWCSESLAMAEELNLAEEKYVSCRCLYEAYKLLGDSENALYYHELLLDLDDKKEELENIRKLDRMEFSKKKMADSLAHVENELRLELENQEQVRKNSKIRMILLTSGVLFLLIAGGLWSRLRYIRKSREEIKQERDRSDNLLLNILPAEIAKELKENGHAQPRDFDMVSILFTDFKDFTKTSERLSADKLVEEINYCFQTFDGIIEKYNIEKIKTIGDSYMAAGGLPITSEDSVKNTILAALEMQHFITTRKQEIEHSFEMRAGVHTGPVVAGIVGVKKFQYDLWGDTVNIASRMENEGLPSRVNISQATYELLKDDPQFAFEKRGKIEVKGKGEMDMWFVERKLNFE